MPQAWLDKLERGKLALVKVVKRRMVHCTSTSRDAVAGLENHGMRYGY